MSERRIFHWHEWWGSTHCLVRAPLRESGRHEVVETEKIATVIEEAAAQLPGGPVSFTSPRRGTEGVTERVLRNEPDRAIDISYLEWAEREVQPERWERVAINGAAAIVGLRDDVPVAFIATRRANTSGAVV